MIDFDELDKLIDKIESLDKLTQRFYTSSDLIDKKEDSIVIIDNDVRKNFINIDTIKQNTKVADIDINKLISDTERKLKKASRTNIKVNINFEKDKILRLNKELISVGDKFMDDSEIVLRRYINNEDNIDNDFFE